MRILIVSVFFPPQNSIASLRPYSWAKYWTQWGHDVTVLTTPKPVLSSNSPMPCQEFKLLEVPVPDLKILRSAINVSNFDENCERDNFRKEKIGFLRRLLNTLQNRYGIFNQCRFPDKHDLWARRAFYAVSKKEWDIVVTTAWPYSTHFVGYYLKKNRKTCYWILDWRDLWTDNHLYNGLPILRNLEHVLEYAFHKKADVITTVSDPLASKLREKSNTKVSVIYNGFDPDDYNSLPVERIFPSDGVFRIVYTGTIYLGKQDPSPLFATIRILSNKNLVTPEQLQVIMVGRNANVTGIAKSFGVENYVQYQGFVPRQDALRMQRDANALLFLEFEAPGVEGILTGKLFEYLFSDPPIIAIGISKSSSAGKIIVETNRGNTYLNDTELLANDLIQLIAGKNPYIRGSENKTRSVIKKFSRAKQAGDLLSLVEQVAKY